MSETPPPTARPGPAFADLHLHTLFSDGTFTPEELAGHGARFGLVAMALTDHDTVEGCARMDAACCIFWATSSTRKMRHCKPA
jgi:hypothetical protein